MTQKPVDLSITVIINGEVIQYSRKLEMLELESGISHVVQELGNKVLMTGLKGLDQELGKRVPTGWRNIGIEERSIRSSVGWIHYQRRISMDEMGVRRKPLDEA